MVAFAALAFYSYGLLPQPSVSIWFQLEGVFSLSVGIGGVTVMLYSIARRSSFVSRVSDDVLAYDFRLFPAVFAFGFAAALFYVYRTTQITLLLVPIPPTLTFAVLAARNIYPFAGKATFGALTEDRLAKLVTNRASLKRIAERRTERFSLLLSKAGEIGNPYVLSATSVARATIALAIALPAAVILAWIVWLPLAAVLAIPLLLYMWPELRLRDRARARRDGVERELPFFSILVHVLGSAGVPLFTILSDVSSTRIFDFIRREALLVKRDVSIFGSDPTESFERLASYHPSKKLAAFLNGYTSKVRSGGDIPTYLSGESGGLLRELEAGWARYSSSAGTIGSMMITLFGIIPMLLLVVGIFSPSESVTSLTVFTAMGVPFFAVMMVFVAGRSQPVGEEPLSGSPRLSLLLSLPGLLVGFFLGQLWLGIASALFIFCTVYGYSVVEQRREMAEVNEALPRFLNDLMEFKRQEYDLTKALVNIATYNKYTPAFDKLMAKVASQLRAGTPMDEIETDPRSRLGRVVFFVLGQMTRSGGGTVDTYYQLATYTGRVVEMRQNTMAEMKPYLMLAFFSPIMIAFGMAFIGGVIGSFGGIVQPGLKTIGASLELGVATKALKEVSSFLVVASSAALGIVSAKLIDLTVKNTLRASINVITATVATYALTQVNLAQYIHF